MNLGVAAFGVIGTTAAFSVGAPMLLTVSGLYIAYETLHGEDFVDKYLGCDAEIWKSENYAESIHHYD